MKIFATLTVSVFALLPCGSLAGAERWSYVDDDGVLRWKGDESEIALFGVNYYTPFTADYEGLDLLGEDHRKTIDRDVAHFAEVSFVFGAWLFGDRAELPHGVEIESGSLVRIQDLSSAPQRKD